MNKLKLPIPKTCPQPWSDLMAGKGRENDVFFGIISAGIKTDFYSLQKIACWESEPHDRPTFVDILQALDKIQRSEFTQTPHESFHTLQDNWKVEIEEVLHGLRTKEKVRYFRICKVFVCDGGCLFCVEGAAFERGRADETAGNVEAEGAGFGRARVRPGREGIDGLPAADANAEEEERKFQTKSVKTDQEGDSEARY